MNVHHLEVFYHVAKHGGIAEAVRNFPYSIQQPAVSSQIAQLEDTIGTSLFQRRPFQLTGAGKELFDFVAPFFGNLESMAQKLRDNTVHNIRIGASEVILRDHLPKLIDIVRAKFPKLKIALREANQPDLQSLLERTEIDLAITLIPAKTLPTLCAQPLLTLAPILLVAKKSKIESAEELWKRKKISEPLVALPPKEIACQQFHQELARRKIEWPTNVEVSSLTLVEAYVANGYGIGLSIRVPEMKLSPEVRALDLPGFPPVTVGAIWRGKPSPLLQAFVQEIHKRARNVSGEK